MQDDVQKALRIMACHLALTESLLRHAEAARKSIESRLEELAATKDTSNKACDLDAALVNLSLEQRIAVKSMLKHAGMLG